MMKPGDKVVVSFTDALGDTSRREGVVVAIEGDKVRVDITGIAILVDAKDVRLDRE